MKLSTLAILTWVAPFAAASDLAVERSNAKSGRSSMSCNGDFNDGVYLGAEVAEKLWKQQGSSCSNIWGFEESVENYLDNKYPTDTSNWKKNSCHQGMEKGAEQVVAKYEKQCLDDTPAECNDLGQAAAQIIAYDYCPFSAIEDEPVGYGAPNYKQSCRSVAYGVCEGAIYGYVRDNGCGISTSKLNQLQAKCGNQVDSMTGGEDATKLLSKTSQAEPANTLSFMKTTAVADDLANCFRKCERDFTEGSTEIERCRSYCRSAGNNSNTGGDYKNSRNTSGRYSDGVTKGKQEAEKIWRNNGSTCSYVWNFEDDVDQMLDRKYWADTSYNDGVKDGAEMIVNKYERQCLNNNVDECDDLGQAAAQIIAYDYCPISAIEDEPVGYGTPNYKATCRSVAYGICKGAIYGYVRDNGCGISTSTLLNLQDDCEYQVDSMTGGSVAAAKSNLRKV